MDLRNLALFKRKLQLEGVYPIVVMQNGKMVRIYVNHKPDLSNDKQSFSSKTERTKRKTTLNKRQSKRIRQVKLNQQLLSPQMNKIKRSGQFVEERLATTTSTSTTTEKSMKMVSMGKWIYDQQFSSITINSPQTVNTMKEGSLHIEENKTTKVTETTASGVEEVHHKFKIKSIIENIVQNNGDSSDVNTSTTTDSITSITESDLSSTEMSSTLSSDTTTIAATTQSNIGTIHSTESVANIIEQQADSSTSKSETHTIDYTRDSNTISTVSDNYYETTTLMTDSIEGFTRKIENSVETLDTMDYVADDGAVNIPKQSHISKLDEMSFFSDDISDQFQDEYKMDQLTSLLIYRMRLKQFNANEKQVLRSMFRSKWKEIRNEVKDLRFINNNKVLTNILKQ